MGLFKKKKKEEIVIQIPEMTTDEEKSNEINNVFIDMDNHLEEKSAYGDNFDTLNDYEKKIYVVNSFLKEVCNGGFEQYLFNSSGARYDLLKESLKAIKADYILGFYKEIFDIMPDSLPIDEDERYNVLHKIFKKKVTKLVQECDNKFYDVNEMVLQELVYNYIKENEEYFDKI